MEFEKIEHEGISEKIIAYVKNQIIDGTLKAGQRLPSEDTLASQMGVGRGTIREALKVLSYTGFLEKRNNRTYVSDRTMKGYSPADITIAIHRFEGYMEIIGVRRVIEPELAALAASRGKAEDIASLSASLKEMEDWENNPDRFSQHDNEFHLALAHASGNALFEEIMKSIQKVMRSNLTMVIQRTNISPRSLDYHKKIFEAVKEGNPAKARRVTLSHIVDIEKAMKVLYNEQKNKEN